MTSETTEKIAQDNNLSTDEILSIVKKNQKKFSKETTISGKISNLFKRQPLKELALDPNIEKSKNDELNENNSADELDSIEKDIKSEIEEEEKDQEKEQEVLASNRKKYTEEETNQKAKELAKKYYYYGYNLGVKNIKKELLKGENKISLALKNLLDNLMMVSEKLTDELNSSLNKKIFEICNQILGYEINKQPERFVKKITDLSNQISKSIKELKVLVNKEDYNSIKNHLKTLKEGLSIEFDVDEKLQRGDIVIKSGDITLEEINSKKIKLSNDSKIDLSVISEDG
ncbi:MAG: hypothetical protein CMM96_07125 [Rickettsiales bacterium]|nr:hypothetical protein [Rickettsiales bacterium]|tara:strand:- start:249 stop:1109 length:861 start_codon:yes stop_codon:yes gene_type:complete